MTIRRLFLGSLTLFMISLWCWSRPAAKQVHAHPVNPALVAVEADEECDSNHDEQEQRFRTCQSHHWRQVMIGSR